MKHSDSIVNIAPAFLAAQKKIDSAIKGSANDYFHSKYADLNAVIDACKSELNNNDIAVLQPLDGDYVETILLHKTGEWLSSRTPLVAKKTITTKPNGEVVETISDPQANGSGISYARRYGLQAMVLLKADDDDANAATNNTNSKVTAKKAVAKPTPQTPDKPPEIEVCSMADCTTPNLAVPQQVVKYSMDKFGKVVCYKCQQKLK